MKCLIFGTGEYYNRYKKWLAKEVQFPFISIYKEVFLDHNALCTISQFSIPDRCAAAVAIRRFVFIWSWSMGKNIV